MFILHYPLVCTIITKLVRPSVNGQLAKMLITLEPHVYFDQILHTNACQQYLITGICNSIFYGRGLAEHHYSWLWSVSENAHNS